MKRVGIIGGLGPQTTIDYYTSIIAKYQERVGIKDDLPELFINSINMYDIYRWLANNEIEELIAYITNAARVLENSGADFIIIAGNTPHIVFQEIQNRLNTPMISIVEETFKAVHANRIKKIGFIGTQFTMEHDFFKKPFLENGIDVILPCEKDRLYIHKKITEELFKNCILSETKEEFLKIIQRMKDEQGIEAIILGCTELPLLFGKESYDIPFFNPMESHIQEIVRRSFL